MSSHDDDRRHDDARASEPQDGQGEDKKPSPLKNPRVKWTLIILGLLAVVLFIVWLVHHLLVGRYLQETNDAYLQADSVAVAPRVNGYVTQVFVQDHAWVKAGQPLLQIDDRTYRAQLEQAQAAVAVRQADIVAAQAGVDGYRAQLAQSRTQVTSAAAQLKFANAEVARFAPLAASGADTHEHQEQLHQQRDQAKAQYDAARAQVTGADSQIAAGEAQLEQAQAGLKQAQANVDQAQVAMEDTHLKAAIAGRLGDKTVQVGQFLSAGARTMTIVPVDALYLTANFKETQVGLMREGQPVEIKVDALSGVTLRGHVESLSPGTGSQFALLPPENATGNFTKVVQRVPVRIRVDAGAEARKVLVPGMSVTATVDTRSAKDAKDRTQDEADRADAQDRDKP
ncbi:membrane fusion protein, multidrug efflux system [Pseudoxanthomonas sp. GM95]|uniref:HlyD family secretion protein n=1 Tax=Pseudoxanthomonas sp. GM95 TaxID=1881043 RepID=UPI0008B2BA9C|nr:HlyD family secretion protein [Pseudoxanthomonas sp. GM95]SEL87684.1 membrane fusion protein, multidrug efflux system [Pseudoxanthomonas sp. GM95]